MIAVRDEPRILSQTQRRRRYPERQQRHCHDCFQPMHGKQKYNAPLEIFKQFLKSKQYAGSIIRTISEISTMFQFHIVGIGHIVMTSVRMVLTAGGPCNTPS